MNIHPHAQPFYWRGKSRKSFLLVHGFTSSPGDMRTLGEHLNSKGYGVAAPLLPGHGTTPKEMACTGWREWYAAVEGAYLELAKVSEQVIPVGLSMGGLLCLYLAMKKQISQMVSLSTPLCLTDERIYQGALPENEYVKKDITPKEQAHKLAQGRFSYDAVSTNSLSSLLELIDIVKEGLPGMKTPVLIVHSRMDPTARPESARYLYDHVGSTEKKLVWLESSRHVITVGKDSELLLGLIMDFTRDLPE